MKGLNLLILASLAKENKYGLQIIKDIKSATNTNFDLKLPSLYNSIKKMEGYGYLQTYWENSEIGGKRRYCSLLEKGRNYLFNQEKNLDDNDRKIIKKLIDGDFEIEQDKDETIINTLNSSIAIQPNFLSQCYDNDEQTSFDNSSIQPNQDNVLINENIKQKSFFDSPTNNESMENMQIKDIFGDMVYEDDKAEENFSENKEMENATQQIKNKEIDKLNFQLNDMKNPSIVTDKQKIDENYKINLTLKSENFDNTKFDNVVEEIKEPNNGLPYSLSHNNDEATTFSNSTNEEINSISTKNEKITKSATQECLDYFESIGISHSIYDANQFTKKLANDSKYFKRKFKFWQACTTAFITGLILICLYIFLDIRDYVNDFQKYAFIVICAFLLAYIVYNLVGLIKYPKLVTTYQKTQKKLFLNILYIALISTLIILAICFFCGMTFSNIQFYYVYLCLPIIYLQIGYTDIMVEYSMAKNRSFFQNK